MSDNHEPAQLVRADEHIPARQTNDAYSKIYAFLAGEMARKHERQCVRMTVSQGETAYREMPLWERVRVDNPEDFELGNLNITARQIIQLVEDYTDGLGANCPPAGQRFCLRTFQHIGARVSHWITIPPSHDVSNTQIAGGFTPDAQGMIAMQMTHNAKLIDHNQRMAAGTIGTLLDRATSDRNEIAELKARIRELERDLAVASDASDVRMQEALNQERSNDRKDKALGKILPMLPLVVAKIMSKAGMGGASGGGSDIALVVNELAASITQPQYGKIMSVLTQPQLMLFAQAFELAKMAVPAEEPAAAKKDA